MRTIEISEDRFERFERLPLLIQEALREQNCTQCDKELTERDIMFVACENGQIRWWHYGDPSLGLPC